MHASVTGLLATCNVVSLQVDAPFLRCACTLPGSVMVHDRLYAPGKYMVTTRSLYHQTQPGVAFYCFGERQQEPGLKAFSGSDWAGGEMGHPEP